MAHEMSKAVSRTDGIGGGGVDVEGGWRCNGTPMIHVFIMRDLKREKSDNQFITEIITISSGWLLIYA